MQNFMVYVCFFAWYLVAYRVAGFIRIQKAKHRKLLLSRGYEELNEPHRLRGERRMRIASIAYVVISASLFLFGPTFFFGVPFIQLAACLMLSVFPAVALLVVLKFFEEAVVPYSGVLYTTVRDREMRKVAAPLVPNGELASGRKLDPIAAGLTNPFAFFVHREAAADGKQVA